MQHDRKGLHFPGLLVILLDILLALKFEKCFWKNTYENQIFQQFFQPYGFVLVF